MPRVFIGLGSNLGDRHANIQAAVDWLDANPAIKILCRTQAMETEPWGVVDQPRFVNAVVSVHTGLSPEDLLAELERAEKELGRTPGETRWGPRIIDLDILLYGELVYESPRLTIPHAHLCDRRFILMQLMELDDRLIHPGLGTPLRDLLVALDRSDA